MYAYNLRYHHVYSRDKAGYDRNGAELRPDAVRSPGYPLFLLPFVDRVVGRATVLGITLAQGVLGTLSILLAYALGRAFLPQWGALVAATLTAVSPHLINAGVYVLSETWYTFLLLAGLWVLATAAGRPSRLWPWLAGGMLLGAAALTRPGLQYFPILLLPLLWLVLGPGRRLPAAGLLLCGFLTFLSPWIVRNEVVLGHSSDPTLEINFLHHAMYPDFMYHEDPRTYGFPYRFDPHTPQINRSAGNVLQAIGRSFREEPGRELRWYLFGKPIAFWSWNIVQGAGDVFIYPVTKSPYQNSSLFRATHDIMAWTHWPLVLLGALGTLLAWVPAVFRQLSPAERFGAQICSLLLVYETAIHMLGAPFPRYSVPLLPVLFALALFGAAQLLRAWHPSARSPIGSG